MKTDQFAYQGDELDLFALALRWKSYAAARLTPHFGPRVLEVGAGFGSVTRSLLHERVTKWTCLEPDRQLADRIPKTLADHPLRSRVAIECGTTVDLGSESGYDTVLYFDVLEHIEHDNDELARAASLLADGGNIIVLAPAFQTLYTAFDRALGHFRRYTVRTLIACGPRGMRCEQAFYLDAVGLLASLANKVLLKQHLPTRSQILFWDRRIVPASRMIDPIIGFSAGRSVVAIWRKMGAPESQGSAK